VRKTLVTGATGFVGGHVARLLVERGHEVRALARPGSSRALLDDLDIEWVTGDLRDRDSLLRAAQGCQALFHVAADYRLWAANPEELYESNVEGTRSILEAAGRAGIERTVYTSTVGALGIPDEGGSGSEDTPTSLDRMIGDYKRSKFLAEEVARGAAADGQDVVIVNPSTPVGPGDVKPTPTGKMIVDFLRGKMPAYLDTGLNLISVEDAAIGHLLAYERGASGRRYILGAHNLTLHSILDMLAEISGSPAPRMRIPYPAAYAAALVSAGAAKLRRRAPGISPESVRMAHHYMFFDSTRARIELGLPQSSVRDALSRAVRWFMDCGYVDSRGDPGEPALQPGRERSGPLLPS
jgi:dihydroflavonol-4-reductase